MNTCVHVWVWIWLKVLWLKGVARHSKSQRLLARPAASAGLHVSVSEVVHRTLFRPWLRKSSDCLLCLLKLNVPMVPPSLPQVLYTEIFPWRPRMFTRVWQKYSSVMNHNSTNVSQQQNRFFIDSFWQKNMLINFRIIILMLIIIIIIIIILLSIEGKCSCHTNSLTIDTRTQMKLNNVCIIAYTMQEV